MSFRIYRTLRRAITIRDAIIAAIAIVLSYVPRLLDAFDLLRRAKDDFVAMAPWLSILRPFVLSPYFPIAVIVLAFGILLWLHWPVPSSARAEAFIEMLEERIDLAQRLLKHTTNISMIESRTWEEQTVLDMAHYVQPESRYIALFREAGALTAHEYELGHEGIRRALIRQVRALRETIDHVDLGKVQEEDRRLRTTGRTI
ncbi:MAG: hypothetical protein ACLQAT_03750 [Candidatus Binataceae bacterium]